MISSAILAAEVGVKQFLYILPPEESRTGVATEVRFLAVSHRCSVLNCVHQNTIEIAPVPMFHFLVTNIFTNKE